MKTKLWKLLLRPAVCMPSLIVQWHVRSFHFLCAWLRDWLILKAWGEKSTVLALLLLCKVRKFICEDSLECSSLGTCFMVLIFLLVLPAPYPWPLISPDCRVLLLTLLSLSLLSVSRVLSRVSARVPVSVSRLENSVEPPVSFPATSRMCSFSVSSLFPALFSQGFWRGARNGRTVIMWFKLELMGVSVHQDRNLKTLLNLNKQGVILSHTFGLGQRKVENNSESNKIFLKTVDMDTNQVSKSPVWFASLREHWSRIVLVICRLFWRHITWFLFSLHQNECARNLQQWRTSWCYNACARARVRGCKYLSICAYVFLRVCTCSVCMRACVLVCEMEAGCRWMISDCQGGLLEGWNSFAWK